MQLFDRSFWIDVHFWLTVVAGLPLAIVALTGGVLALDAELRVLSFPEIYDVASEGERMAPVEAARLLERKYPDASIIYVGTTPEPGKAWTALSSKGRLVIDPYERVIRPAPEGGGWIGTVERWHRALAMGTPGRYVVAGASIVLLILIATGLWLWIPMWRGTFRRWWRKQSALGWHNMLGLGTLPLIVAMALTGVMLTFHLAPYVYSLTGTPPIEEPVVESSPEEESILLSRAVERAQSAHPSSVVTAFAAPWNPEQPIRVFLTRPGDTGTQGWLRTYVHPSTGQVMKTVNRYEHSFASIVEQVWFQFHTGGFFGLAGRIVWGLASIMLPVVAGTGLWRWWIKRQAGRRNVDEEATPSAST